VFALILSFQIAVYIATTRRIFIYSLFTLKVFDGEWLADDHLVAVAPFCFAQIVASCEI
jgi:hypothetical protein